jgi:hypothetical protein
VPDRPGNLIQIKGVRRSARTSGITGENRRDLIETMKTLQDNRPESQ